jgi:hypothetical protein
MLRRAIVTLMLASLATAAAGETVYKWMDGRGQVHYTDLPPSEPGAKLIETFERVQVQDNSQQPSDTVEAPPASGDEPPAEESSAAAAAAVQQDLERTRVVQCKQAQDRYQTYITSQRLYKQGADGKREYLTDEELAAARIQAKQAVADLCK